MMYKVARLKRKNLFYCLTLFFISFMFVPGVSLAKNSVSSAQEESDQIINDFSLAGYGREGRKTWEITGKSADIFTDVVKLKQIVGNLYDEEENIKLTADKGDFNKENGMVHLEQNVIITTSGGARLTTDSLHWDRQNQLVSTDDKVNIQREDMHLVAQGAQGRPDLNEVVLEKDIQMNIADGEVASGSSTQGQEVVITCDGPLQIDYQKNVATFNKNVKVDRQGMQILSDIMEVYFITSEGQKRSPEETAMPLGGKIDKIIARGNVKIIRGENISYSEEATYSASDKKIILSGRPKLVIYSRENESAPFGD